MKTTKIEWTEATWNPSIGCSKVSAGCKSYSFIIIPYSIDLQLINYHFTVKICGFQPDNIVGTLL